MLDPNLLRNELDAVAVKLARRGFKLDLDLLRSQEERRKVLQVETETLQAERNSRSKSIGAAKARGEDIEPLRREVNELGDKLDAAKAALDALQSEIRDYALTLPNLPDDAVPDGKDDSENTEVTRWGEPRQYDFAVRDHVDLGEMAGGLDFAAAVKLTGSRFVVMKGQIARMHRALSQFMLDLHTEQHGYPRPTCLTRQPRHAVRYRPAAEVRRRPVPYPSAGRRSRQQQLRADPNGGSAADQPGARRDRGRGISAAENDRTHAMLPC